MRIGNREFDFENHTYVMGILNMTPDSFSDGGMWNSEKKAMKHVEDMLKEGADIIDVGGESTRPGYTRVSVEEEIRRTAPIIQKIKQHYDIPISIDTSKSEVARAAVDAGADMINEVTGLFGDPNMGKVIAQSGVVGCLMHNGLYIVKAENCANRTMDSLLVDLKAILARAEEAGIAKDKIILDPGVGFGKSQEGNATVLANLERLRELKYPLLLGTSRKSVLGYLLDLPVDQRKEGTMATSVLAAQAHYGIVRVHDVMENRRAIQTVEALRQWMK